MFLNAYTRIILRKKLKVSQTCFCAYPGWVQTLGGGLDAPLTVQEGVKSVMNIIKFSDEEAIKQNGSFYDDNC